MATYQEFKDSLIGKLATSNDPELVEMVEALITYTDGLIEVYVAPGTPPPLPNSGNSRSMAPGIATDDDSEPKPPLPGQGTTSKIS